MDTDGAVHGDVPAATAAMLMAAMFGLIGCAPGARVAATLVAAEEVPGTAGTTLVVDLQDGTIAGATRIALGVAAGDLACEDGSVPATVDLTHGTRMTFDRVGDVVETSDPPIIGATNVEVDC